MNLAEVRIRKFSGASPGARSATEEWASRAGVLVQVRTRDGLVAQGEASPLPGYSPDSYEEARACLERFDWQSIPELDQGDDGARIGESLRKLGEIVMPPSARFAVEMVFLYLAGQRAKRPVWALLPRSAAGPVPISALAGNADDSGVVEAATSAASRGVSAVKLKFRGPLTDDRLGRICAVRKAIGGIGLRLDANRSLTVEDAMRSLDALARADIEFMEEPVPSSQLPLMTRSAVPIALDESLQDPETWNRLEPHLNRIGCAALVLKPMALGGFAECIEGARRAREHGLDATISHLFDGPVALSASAHLALAVGSRRYASGLDPHGALRAWPDTPLPLHTASALVEADRPGLGVPPLPRGAI